MDTMVVGGAESPYQLPRPSGVALSFRSCPVLQDEGKKI